MWDSSSDGTDTMCHSSGHTQMMFSSILNADQDKEVACMLRNRDGSGRRGVDFHTATKSSIHGCF